MGLRFGIFLRRMTNLRGFALDYSPLEGSQNSEAVLVGVSDWILEHCF